jgi:DNA-binding NarL/FixJ family response regulator
VEAILSPQTDLHLLGCAGNEDELWPMLKRTEPIVAILDFHDPGRDGLALCLELKRRPNPPGVVLYSANTHSSSRPRSPAAARSSANRAPLRRSSKRSERSLRNRRTIPASRRG